MGNERRIYSRRALRIFFTLAVGGALAGFCNGLLGAGGGIILVFALAPLVARDEEGERSIYANALLVMLPLSMITLWRYLSSGAVGAGEGATLGSPLLLGALAGGAIGALTLGKLRGKRLRELFALLTAISGVIMLCR